jgi:hypothetical protein
VGEWMLWNLVVGKKKIVLEAQHGFKVEVM